MALSVQEVFAQNLERLTNYRVFIENDMASQAPMAI
jgi:predicted NBD/HSP70 family sugar kinase